MVVNKSTPHSRGSHYGDIWANTWRPVGNLPAPTTPLMPSIILFCGACIVGQLGTAKMMKHAKMHKVCFQVNKEQNCTNKTSTDEFITAVLQVDEMDEIGYGLDISGWGEVQSTYVLQGAHNKTF